MARSVTFLVVCRLPDLARLRPLPEQKDTDIAGLRPLLAVLGRRASLFARQERASCFCPEHTPIRVYDVAKHAEPGSQRTAGPVNLVVGALLWPLLGIATLYARPVPSAATPRRRWSPIAEARRTRCLGRLRAPPAAPTGPRGHLSEHLYRTQSAMAVTTLERPVFFRLLVRPRSRDPRGSSVGRHAPCCLILGLEGARLGERAEVLVHELSPGT